MKRTLILFATALLCAVSCATTGEFSGSDRFQDGIYYKPNPRMSGREPLSEEEFRYLAQMENYSRDLESNEVVHDTVYVVDYNYPYYRNWRWGWHFYPNYWSGYHWGYYNYYGYSYWGYPYYYGWYDPWYDPWYWDDYYWYGYPYHYGYYGHPYHHHYYASYHSGTYARRTGSATSGQYIRPAASRNFNTSRSAAAMAQRDINRIKVQRNGPRTTAVNREPDYSETQFYRSATATRASSSASYNGSRSSGATRYDSSSSSRSSSSSSSSSHSSHSSGGGGYHGGGGHR